MSSRNNGTGGTGTDEPRAAATWWSTMGFILVAWIVSLLSGCGEGESTNVRRRCEQLGLCDGLPPTPIAVDFVCDKSIGAPCSRAVAFETITRLLPQLASRPGSLLRFWGQDTEVSGTALLGTAEVTAPRHAGARVRRLHEERFVRTARTELLRSAEEFFLSAPKRRSPIAESLTLIARTPPPQPDMARVLIISTDLRQVVPEMGLDWECRPVGHPRRLLARWHRAQILPPGSLRGMRVIFSNTALRPVEGRDCPATLARTVAIESFWRQALQAAGTSDVRFQHGTATLDDGPTDGVRLPRPDGGAP